MSIPPKWLAFLFLFWLGTLWLCSVTLGTTLLDSDAAGTITGIANVNANVGTIPAMWLTLTKVFTFGHGSMPFFTEGIGVYIRLVILCLTGAIALPLAYDTIRLIKVV